MYTVDLHNKGKTVSSAISNLHGFIKLARKTKERCLCLIVGQGSTGGTHKIKTGVLEELNNLKEKNQIKDFILGNEVDIFNTDEDFLTANDKVKKSEIIRKQKELNIPDEILSKYRIVSKMDKLFIYEKFMFLNFPRLKK